MNIACRTSEFFNRLPRNPYCTDVLGVTDIRSKTIAINKKYIQINPPYMTRYLIFDIDREEAAFAWHDNNLPAPYWTCKNPKNGHAHIVYRLKIPFCTSNMAHLEPIRYAAAIQSALVQRLKADRGYAGLLTKNPCHPHWQKRYWTEHEYTLDELADNLDLRGHPIKGPESFGLGRNCALFDNARHWAYKTIREFWGPNYKHNWNDTVYSYVEAINAQFIVPLPISEVKAIAKSVSKWTYREFTPERFRQSQAAKGKKGGLAGLKENKAKAGRISKGGGRPDKKALLPNVLELKAAGCSNRVIAESLKLSPSTISLWIRTPD